MEEIKLKKLLYIGALSALLLAACGETETGDNNNAQQDQANSDGDSENVSSKYLAIGDTAEFDDAKFTLKNVTTTDARNEFDETNPNKVIKVEYELENLSDADLSYGMDLTVYDGAGNKMETYPLDNSMGSVASGKKVQGTEHFGIMEGGKIEIHYAPIVSFEKAAVFEVEVQ